MAKDAFFPGINKPDRLNVVILTVLWLGMVVLVNPVGEFPLNDDWVYARAAQSVFAPGGFTLKGGNTSPNLLAQAVFAALFCLPFGFSFTTLRISTLVLGWLGVLATYALLRAIQTSPSLSLLGALLIALNPIYFGLSNSFMTDIPFFAVAIGSMAFLIAGLRNDSRFQILIGLFLSYIALMVRQNGIIIPFVFGCIYLLQKAWTGRDNRSVVSIVKLVATSFAPLLLGLLLQFSYNRWLEVTDRTSPNFGLQVQKFAEILTAGELEAIFRNLTFFGLQSLALLGFFISPLLILAFWKQFSFSSGKQRRTLLLGTSVCLALLLGALAVIEITFPPGNILNDFGLGPLTLHDTFIQKTNLPEIPFGPRVVWTIFLGLGIGCAAILLYWIWLGLMRIVQELRSGEFNHSTGPIVFSLLAGGLFFLPIGVAGTFFDRYLLPLLPLLMLLIFPLTFNSASSSNSFSLKRTVLPLACVVLLILGPFTVSATHDYLAWNRVRWQALNMLMQSNQVLPTAIDGGYEFNGWYLFDPNDVYANSFGGSVQTTGAQKSWWWVVKDDYMMAFGPVSGFRELQRYSLPRWLPMGPESLYLLRKNS
jgi:hypothetical protein